MSLRPFLAMFAIAVAAGTVRADALGDSAAIERRLQDWAMAFNGRDADGACDLFAPDRVYSVPGITNGTREVMCGNLARLLRRDDSSFRYDPPAIHEVLVSGDLAVVRLTWTLTTTVRGEPEITTEEGIDVFRRQPDGRWSLARFIAFTPDPEEG